MVSKLTRLVEALFGSRGRQESAEVDAQAIERSYSIDLPADWPRIEANRSWNHLKVRAPQGYAVIVVGSRDDLIPEDRSALLYPDAWAFLDSVTVRGLKRMWKEAEEHTEQALCTVRRVKPAKIDGAKAVNIHYSQLIWNNHLQIEVRSWYVIRDRKWISFQFAVDERDEARWLPTLMEAQRSVRWTAA